MQQPDFDLSKIKFATNGPTFEKAVALYESGKVTQEDKKIVETPTCSGNLRDLNIEKPVLVGKNHFWNLLIKT